jgi:hypothetical protein
MAAWVYGREVVPDRWCTLNLSTAREGHYGLMLLPSFREAPSISQRTFSSGSAWIWGISLTQGLEVSAHNMLQLQLWANADFLPVLQGHIESGKRLFRVGAHRTLYARVRVLEIITELCNGVPVDKLRIGPRLKYSTLVSGIWQIYPGAVMCFPMTARHQPLALVYMAPLGSQIVMLPPKGTVFKRPLQLFTWPVGTTGQALQGPGIGIYLQAEKLWEGKAPRRSWRRA